MRTINLKSMRTTMIKIDEIRLRAAQECHALGDVFTVAA